MISSVGYGLGQPREAAVRRGVVHEDDLVRVAAPSLEKRAARQARSGAPAFQFTMMTETCSMGGASMGLGGDARDPTRLER